MAFRLAGLCAAAAIALLIAAAGAEGPQAQEGTDLQDPGTDSGQTMVEQIVFASTRDNGLEIYLMDPDGQNAQRLTDNTSGDIFAASSPDGKKLVFDSNRLRTDDEPVNTSDLFVMNTDGTEQTHVTRGSSATWSPDSKNIAYHASGTGEGLPIFSPNPGAATTDSDIFSLNVDDGLRARDAGGIPESTNLTNNGAATIDDDADWSPDGKTIIFTSYNPTTVPKPMNPGSNVFTRDIWVMNADGSGKKNLTDEYNLEERAPAWSPDDPGTRILFSCRRPETNGGSNAFEICVRDVNRDSSGNVTGTSNEVQLTHNTVADSTPNWSPDGTQIVFHRPVGGLDQLFVMNAQKNADGTDPVPVQLTFPPGLNGFAKWGKVRVHE